MCTVAMLWGRGVLVFGLHRGSLFPFSSLFFGFLSWSSCGIERGRIEGRLAVIVVGGGHDGTEREVEASIYLVTHV